jgi:hypothetical protein
LNLSLASKNDRWVEFWLPGVHQVNLTNHLPGIRVYGAKPNSGRLEPSKHQCNYYGHSKLPEERCQIFRFPSTAADSYLQNEMAGHGLTPLTSLYVSNADMENRTRFADHPLAKTIRSHLKKNLSAPGGVTKRLSQNLDFTRNLRTYYVYAPLSRQAGTLIFILRWLLIESALFIQRSLHYYDDNF